MSSQHAIMYVHPSIHAIIICTHLSAQFTLSQDAHKVYTKSGTIILCIMMCVCIIKYHHFKNEATSSHTCTIAINSLQPSNTFYSKETLNGSMVVA